MPRPKNDGRCKRHPKHRQSPGVCSICLSEKLSQLKSHGATSSSRSTRINMDSPSSSSSLSSYSSSSEVSSCSSPMHPHRGQRKGSSYSLSFFTLISGKNKNVLTKSRSLAFATRRNDDQTACSDHHDKKQSGLLSKFLRPRPSSKGLVDNQGLMHSRTTRERVVATVI